MVHHFRRFHPFCFLTLQLVTQVQSLTELCSSMPEDDVNGLVMEYLTKCLKSIDQHEGDTVADIEQLLMGGDIPAATGGIGIGRRSDDEVTDEFGERDFAAAAEAEDGDICSSDDEDFAVNGEDDSEYRDMFVEVSNSEVRSEFFVRELL